MTIEKLPSGNYRIKQMEKGKYYSVTVDFLPTQNEATVLLAEVIKKRPPRVKMTFDEACAAYIDEKCNVISPKTLLEYEANRRKIPEDFSKMKINDITALDVQKLANDWSARLAPKTVANYAGFVMSVLKSVDIDIKAPKLPQKVKKDIYIPTKEDVKVLKKHFDGTKYEVAFFLACLGLRRSEICALTLDDLDGNVLTINKALVQNVDKQWVVKSTKTTDSTRTIKLPDDIVDKIHEQGFIYIGDPGNLYKRIIKAQDKYGLPHFQLHKMRHFFASYMHDLGYSDKQIQEMGGWKTDNVMKRVYQHAMNMDETKTKMSEDISNLFNE